MVMTVLGLKLGSWLKIEQIQNSLRDGIDNPPAQTSTTLLNTVPSIEDNMNKDAIIEILNSSTECQPLIQGKLAEGSSLKKSEKNLICRTVCSHFFASMILQKKSVTVGMKTKLAQSIVEAYDCLKVEGNGKPAEAEFFWEHNGRSTGDHTGFVQNWVRNQQEKARKTMRRKRRAAPELNEDECQAMEELTTFDETEDYQNVSHLMMKTFNYRQMLRKQKVSPFNLCMEFAHLLWHGTTMIDDEFDLMYPNRNAIGTLSSISPFCMMLDHPYNEIACPSIQALMKVMTELTCQGNIRKAEPSGLPPLEDYASVFVRWLQPGIDIDQFVEDCPGDPPFILCNTMAFAEGTYYVIVMKAIFDCGEHFDNAFDYLFKAYKVFNFIVPGKAKKVIELFELLYGIEPDSRLTLVSKLFEKLKLAING